MLQVRLAFAIVSSWWLWHLTNYSGFSSSQLFGSCWHFDVDICKDLYTNVVRSPAEAVDPRNSAEESPVAMQGTAPQHQASAATGHSSFEMSCPFTNQEVQHDLFRSWKETTAYKNDVYFSPKEIDG